MKQLHNLFFSVVLLSFSITAQDALNISEKGLYNRWSIEMNVGQNKAIKPFSVGYYSSDPEKLLNVSGVNHFDLGIRYMFSNSFGLKLDYGGDMFEDLKNAGSLSFDTQQNRFGFQGVINLGRLLHFETFTNRFGLLAHTGIHVSKFIVNEGVNKNISERNGGVMFGLTPQVRLAKWLALTVDFTVVNNVRQHLNWDGSNSGTDNNLTGVLYNTSIGFSVYFGKNEKHADWYINPIPQPKSDEEVLNRLEAIETQLNDTDRDGVVDHLDLENNTPAGVSVDTKGRFFDVNRNGFPDELESRDGKETTTSALIKVASAEKQLVENGLVNVFFDVNSDTPNAGSTNNVYTILYYLRENPKTNAKLIGFSDARGNEKTNKDLSQRRAKSVYDLLIANGIDANRVVIEGLGVDLNYSNSSKTSNDLARRVVIKIEKIAE